MSFVQDRPTCLLSPFHPSQGTRTVKYLPFMGGSSLFSLRCPLCLPPPLKRCFRSRSKTPGFRPDFTRSGPVLASFQPNLAILSPIWPYLSIFDLFLGLFMPADSLSVPYANLREGGPIFSILRPCYHYARLSPIINQSRRRSILLLRFHHALVTPVSNAGLPSHTSPPFHFPCPPL